jgi:hypothetical protein
MARRPKKKNGWADAPPELNWFQKWRLIMLDRGVDEFKNEAERRAAWEVHREAIIEELGKNGCRPDAFWRYDRPDVDLDKYENELAALVDL